MIYTHFPGHILFTGPNTWMLPCILQGASVGRMAARLKVIKHGDYYDVRLLGFDRSNYEYKEDATDIKDKWIRWANNFFYDLQQQGLITPFSFEVTSNFYFNKSNGKVYTK